MQKKIFISGGASPTSQHLAKTFLKKGHLVSLLSQPTHLPKDLREKVTLVPGTLLQEQKLVKSLKEHDVVIHADELNNHRAKKKLLYTTNVTGTETILKASLINRIPRFIFLSSSDVYGIKGNGSFTEESPFNPIDHYGISKVMAERLCQKYKDQGLPVTILRPRPILGPTTIGMFSLWFESIYKGRRIYLSGNKKNKYQLLALSDLCEAVYKVFLAETSTDIFNLGAKEFQTWHKDLQALIRFDKSYSKITHLPTKAALPLLYASTFLHVSPLSPGHFRPFSHSISVSTARAEKQLQWTAKKSNKDLLLDSYLWYKKNRKKILDRRSTLYQGNWDFKLLDVVSRF